MRKTLSILAMASVAYLGVSNLLNASDDSSAPANDTEMASTSKSATAIFAGGCFWCIESDFEKLEGVISAESGYTGGSADTADYKTVSYTETGHYEAVQVLYDPAKVSYSELVEYFWRHIDPTDDKGQFCDKGSSYKSAIFYDGSEQKKTVMKSLTELNTNKPFDGEIVTAIAQAKPFYRAEEYHQDYYKKNPIRYKLYRTSCGRDKRVAKLWGK